VQREVTQNKVVEKLKEIQLKTQQEKVDLAKKWVNLCNFTNLQQKLEII